MKFIQEHLSGMVHLTNTNTEELTISVFIPSWKIPQRSIEVLCWVCVSADQPCYGSDLFISMVAAATHTNTAPITRQESKFSKAKLRSPHQPLESLTWYGNTVVHNAHVAIDLYVVRQLKSLTVSMHQQRKH